MKKQISILLVVASVLGVGYLVLWRTKQPVISMKKLEGVENIIPIAVIGSGPAGLSAALYGARAKVHTVVFEGKQPGGQLTKTTLVENWPGVGTVMGPDVMQTLKAQATQFGAVTTQDAIISIDCSQWPYKMQTLDGNTAYAMSIVLATGANPLTLDVPGEDVYWGGDRGVTACAICDAPFYKDKDVVVVGGGDSACEEALQLAPYAKSVTMLVRRDVMRASATMQERIAQEPKIKVRYNTQITAIKGDEKVVTAIDVETNGKKETLPISGVFLAVGHKPNSDLVKGCVETDSVGYVILPGDTQQTSKIGIFAAGDVCDRRYRQAGIASGDGIKAALDIAEFLREIGFNDAVAVSIKDRLYDPKVGKKIPLEAITSVEQFKSMVIESEGPVVVEFYGDKCPSCVQMMPLLEEAAGTFEGSVKFYKVHALKLYDLAKQYEVGAVPTILMFNEGKIVGRAQEAMSKKDLYYFVKNIIGSAA